VSEHPFFFTWRAQRDAKPVQLLGGEGAWFETPDGRWLDLGSLIYQMNAGHGRGDIVSAVQAQAGRLCVSLPGAIYPEKTALAERLLGSAPEGFSKVFFTLGGSDANENALKMARLATGRFKTISRYRSYHGATMGAVGLTGDWRRRAVDPVLPGAVHVLEPDWVASSTDELTRIPEVMRREGGIGAVFAEPVVGANGVRIPPAGYFAALREACDEQGALLVADEVLTGFGRTGKMFAIEHFDGVVPDMITLGKAITAGYGTLGAVLVHERVASHFEEETLACGLTHYAHPLGVAAALAALDVYVSERLPERAAALEPLLLAGLASISEHLGDRVLRHRAIGLLGALDLDLTAQQWAKLPEGLAARRVHLHVNPRVGALVLAPPLCITEDELAIGLVKLTEAIEEATS